LKDTVEDYADERGTGTGFVFGEYKPQALLDAIERALRVFGNKKAWTRLCRRAMSMNFSWDRSAETYSELYQKLAH
jgi:starch synthase